MPKPNHYFSKYGGWRFSKGNASVRSLAPPTICICIFQGKMIRKIPVFFVGDRFHLQYLSAKKKKHQRSIICSPDMEVQKFKKRFQASAHKVASM
jgi:hypothetical protein